MFKYRYVGTCEAGIYVGKKYYAVNHNDIIETEKEIKNCHFLNLEYKPMEAQYEQINIKPRVRRNSKADLKG